MVKHLKPMTAMVTAACMLGPSLSFAQATLVENGSFDNNSAIPWETPGWWAGGEGTSGVDDKGRFCTTVTKLGTEKWGVQLRQSDIHFEQGETYKVRFRAWSSAQTSVIVGAMDESLDPPVFIFDSTKESPKLITTGLDAAEGQLISYDFVAEADTDKARFRFMMGAGIIPLNETLCLDDIVVEPPPKNILENSEFNNDGAGWEVPAWWAEGAGTSEVDGNGRMCTTVTKAGTDDWGAQLRQLDKTFVAGRTYTVDFDAWSSADMSVEYSVIDEPADFAILLENNNVDVTARLDEAPNHFTIEHDVQKDSSEAIFRFLFGGGLVPEGETICVDNVKLLDSEGNSVIQPPPPEVSIIHVNQQGYLPALSKVATYKIIAEDYTTPRTWKLVNAEDVVIASGETTVIGEDANSGDVIQQIDFSDVTTEGSGYTLQIAEGSDVVISHPFDISKDSYDQLKYDALSYFYHTRSGIEILASVVGDEQWARPAGHLSDNAVETYVCKDDPGADTCRTADVSGGWYDAGDQGKYVVNGGISVWTLMNQYERSTSLGRNGDDFAQDTMALPDEETGNGMPDLLDEARWAVEWMLKMQIPAGETFAGMAYHKIHDDGWTGVGTAPHEDTKTRYIQAPTTAATLNLAAIAAQCARVYKPFDADLANRCLSAAEIAYQAALDHPHMYAGIPEEDDPHPEYYSMTNGDGGGLYDDNEVRDDFFWALSELYITTGKQTYLQALKDSDLYNRYEAEDSAADDSDYPRISLFYWAETNGLGLMSILTRSRDIDLDDDLVASAKSLVLSLADEFVEYANQPGYNMPMYSGKLDWGSNSAVANDMMVLGIANDISCAQDTRYVDAMANGFAYLLGNNPLGKSYITGYGENPVEQPHHRFWAHAVNEDYPTPPPGILAGGPNSDHELSGDPISIVRVDADCPAETCYVDDIGSWSTNEITINWNAPLAWVAAYMDEIGDFGLASDAPCQVSDNNDQNGSDQNDNDSKKSGGGAGVPFLLGLLLIVVRFRRTR